MGDNAQPEPVELPACPLFEPPETVFYHLSLENYGFVGRQE